jgi:hypothetical protein
MGRHGPARCLEIGRRRGHPDQPEDPRRGVASSRRELAADREACAGSENDKDYRASEPRARATPGRHRPAYRCPPTRAAPRAKRGGDGRYGLLCTCLFLWSSSRPNGFEQLPVGSLVVPLAELHLERCHGFIPPGLGQVPEARRSHTHTSAASVPSSPWSLPDGENGPRSLRLRPGRDRPEPAGGGRRPVGDPGP